MNETMAYRQWSGEREGEGRRRKGTVGVSGEGSSSGMEGVVGEGDGGAEEVGGNDDTVFNNTSSPARTARATNPYYHLLLFEPASPDFQH